MESEDYGPPKTSLTIPPTTTPEESAAGPYERPPSLEELEERERAKAQTRMSAAPEQDVHAEVPPTPPPEVAP
jgi:hypothetical protein